MTNSCSPSTSKALGSKNNGRMSSSSSCGRPLPSVSVVCSTLLLCRIVSILWPTLLPEAHAFSPAPARSIPTRIPSSRRLASSRSSSGDDDDGDDDVVAEEKQKRPHVVVLGGGFGGINTALTLPTLPWSSEDAAARPRITLVDRSERFVFLPLLYELCVDDAGLDEVAPTFASLLEDRENGGLASSSSFGGLPDLAGALGLLPRTEEKEEESGDPGCEVSFLQAQVEGIDVDNQRVVVSKSSARGAIESLDYDALVIATGSEISLDAIPGAADFALPFYTVEQALELKRRLALLDAQLEETDGSDKQQPVNVVVVGGGYSGVELALNLVDRFDAGEGRVEVSLVHRGKEVLEYATEHNRNTGVDRLKSAGVKVLTSTSVVEVLPCKGEDASQEQSTSEKQQCLLKLSTKRTDESEGENEITHLPTTLLLWTAGATPTSERNAGVRNSILPRDAMGRILTSPTLNVPRHPNVFAVGDCGRPARTPYPGTAQVAIQQATVAAWNVYAALVNDGKSKPLPFKFLNLGEMMTLGSDDATISTLGGAVELSGPAASWLRRWIYAVRMPTPRQGLRAAADGTGRKLARSARRRKSKPVDWK